MESFPGFCYNSGNQQHTVVTLLEEDITVGCGTLYDHKNVDPYELRKMVKDDVLVRVRERYYSNTSQLGQVLMETMLKEVSEFCKINIQESWATQAHQQVCDGVILFIHSQCNCVTYIHCLKTMQLAKYLAIV